LALKKQRETIEEKIK